MKYTLEQCLDIGRRFYEKRLQSEWRNEHSEMERLLPKSEGSRQSQMYAVRDIEEINIYIHPLSRGFPYIKRTDECRTSSVSLKVFM